MIGLSYIANQETKNYPKGFLPAALFILCLASGVLFILRHVLSDLFFGYGQMSETSIHALADLFGIGIFLLPGLVMTTLIQQIFYARQQTRPPFLASLFQAIITLPALWFGLYTASLSGIFAAMIFIHTLPCIILVLLLKKAKPQ